MMTDSPIPLPEKQKDAAMKPIKRRQDFEEYMPMQVDAIEKYVQ
jgi:hypothetical protein